MENYILDTLLGAKLRLELRFALSWENIYLHFSSHGEMNRWDKARWQLYSHIAMGNMILIRSEHTGASTMVDMSQTTGSNAFSWLASHFDRILLKPIHTIQ